jgi:hypothetical protein
VRRPHLRPDSKRDPETGLLPLQPEFLEWLLDPDNAGKSRNQWCRDHGIATNTHTKWIREDPWFQRALSDALVKNNLDPLSVQSIIEAMRKKALEGDAASARLILDYMKFLNPNAGEKPAEAPVEEMTDEELLAEAEMEIARLRAR